MSVVGGLSHGRWIRCFQEIGAMHFYKLLKLEKPGGSGFFQFFKKLGSHHVSGYQRGHFRGVAF